jgi:hypothetical protein
MLQSSPEHIMSGLDELCRNPPHTVAVGDAFANGAGQYGCVVLAVNASITISGRRLLATTPSLTFRGEWVA